MLVPMSILSTKYASVALLVALVSAGLAATGCSSDGGGDTVDLGACPTNSMTQQTAGASLVMTKCVTCHSSTKMGADRAGAPAGLDYDVAATVKSDATSMYTEVFNGRMPIGGALSAADMESVRIYLACLP